MPRLQRMRIVDAGGLSALKATYLGIRGLIELDQKPQLNELGILVLGSEWAGVVQAVAPPSQAWGRSHAARINRATKDIEALGDFYRAWLYARRGHEGPIPTT